MAVAKQNIVLVTPVYRDAERLSVFGPSLARALADSPKSIHWVIADDGSGEEEVRRIAALIDLFREIHADIDLYEKGEHLGKGGTVRSAWEAYVDAEWLAFVDADGSVGARSLVGLIDRAVAVGPGHAVIASRAPDPGTTVVQGVVRKLAHRTFAQIGRLVLRLRVRDMQCGGKVVDSAAFRAVAPRLVENGFAFDAELLVALDLHGVETIEVPVDWMEKPGGSVNAFAQAWPMFAALLRVRCRRAAGHYDPAAGTL